MFKFDVKGVAVNPRLRINYYSTHTPNDMQLRNLESALDLARTMVRVTLSKLRAANQPPFNPEGIIRRILETHFHLTPITTGPTKSWGPYLDAIIEQFRRIELGLDAPLTICDAYKMFLRTGNRPLAYTINKPNMNLGTAAPHLWGNIHVNFDFLKAPHYKRKVIAHTIIHESGHKFCSMFDFAYRNNPAYKGLTSQQLLFTPDAFAFTALSVYENRCITMMFGHETY